MGWRFRRTLGLGSAIRVNISKRGVNSVSFGGRGITSNLSTKGLKTTLSMPGTGISYQYGLRFSGDKRRRVLPTSSRPTLVTALLLLTLAAVIGFIVVEGRWGGQSNRGVAPNGVNKVFAAQSAEAPSAGRNGHLIRAANLRSEPSSSGAVLRVLGKGLTVVVGPSTGGWFQLSGLMERQRDGFTAPPWYLEPTQRIDDAA